MVVSVVWTWGNQRVLACGLLPKPHVTGGDCCQVHFNHGEGFTFVNQILQEWQYHSYWTLKRSVAISVTPPLKHSPLTVIQRRSGGGSSTLYGGNHTLWESHSRQVESLRGQAHNATCSGCRWKNVPPPCDCRSRHSGSCQGWAHRRRYISTSQSIAGQCGAIKISAWLCPLTLDRVGGIKARGGYT